MKHRLKSFGLRSLPLPLRRWMMARRYEREIESTGEAELSQLRKLLSPGELCLDVGCNLGVYTYELARLTGNVIAFEPNPDLVRLVRSLKLKGVEVREVALSSRDGQAELLIPVGGGGHGLASLRGETVEGLPLTRILVPTRRLDSFELAPVAFIKIDVEGFEEQVLEGAKDTIARHRPILLIEIEERHNPGGLSRIAAMLSATGYRGYFFRRDDWHPLKAFDAAVHQRIDETIETVGHSVQRRDYDYVNNFLFLPGDRRVPRV